jgi:hypothetical protein
MPSAQLVSERSTIIALVGCQASWTFLTAPLRPRHPNPVHHPQPYGDLSHISRGYQKSQRQAITFSQQMDSAALAFPAIGDIFTPFLAGTKLPSRKAWLQSSLPCWSSRLRKVSQICSHTPWSCHSWRRQWQVEGLPNLLGRSHPPPGTGAQDPENAVEGSSVIRSPSPPALLCR